MMAVTDETFRAPSDDVVYQACRIYGQPPEELDEEARASVESLRANLPWIAEYDPREHRAHHRAAMLEMALHDLLVAVGVEGLPRAGSWGRSDGS
jgi:hypothetical protein